MVECGKTCVVIFLGLILMTAGFVLTLTGWFAPPMNTFVLTVRMGGPVTLLVGFVLLLCSCMMCSIEQRRCCSCCFWLFPDDQHNKAEPQLIDNDDDDDVEKHAVDVCCNDGVDERDGAMVVVNEGAEQTQTVQPPPPPSSYPKGYQPLATSDKDLVDELHPSINGLVYPQCLQQSVPTPSPLYLPNAHATDIHDIAVHGKGSCPGSRHPRSPCPLTPTARRLRAHHRRLEQQKRLDPRGVQGRNINKVSRRCELGRSVATYQPGQQTLATGSSNV